MAPLPKHTNNTIEHFTHPGHRLAECNDEQGYLCDGCKTPGFGKRYRCNACNFDLHEYCGTCPQNLSISFMHKHSLTLVIRKAQSTRKNDRICNVCREPVEGLFYRCKDCDFDLHPICTKLPESLTHALDKVHPLKLESPPFSSPCAICREVCDSWRYRCGRCSVDIHLQCVLVSCEQSSRTTQRGRPTFEPQDPFHQQSSPFPPQGSFYPHPQHGHDAFADGFPADPVPYPMHHGYAPQPAPQTGGAATKAGGAATTGRGLGRIMFSLVTKLGIGVVSSLIFGVDLSCLL